jgi:hypothetical protein
MENEPNQNNNEADNERVNRVVQDIFNRNNRRTERFTLDNLLKILISKRFFVVSVSITFIIISVIYFFAKDKDFSLKDLENDEMNKYYIGLFFIFLVLIWNIFLFFHKIVFNFDYSKINFSDDVNFF